MPRDVKVLALLSISLLGVMAALFFGGFIGGVFDRIVATGYIFVTVGFIAWWVAAKLNKRWRAMSESERAANPALSELRWYFIFLGAFFTADIFPHVLLIVAGASINVLTVAHWAAHIFLFIELVMAARIAMTIFNPKAKNKVTILVVLMSIGSLAFSAMNPDSLVQIPGSAYPLIVGNPSFALIYTIMTLLTAGLFGLYLIGKGLVSSAPTRMRAILLGIGFWGQVLVGILIHYSTLMPFVIPQYIPLYIYVLELMWVVPPAIVALYLARRA